MNGKIGFIIFLIVAAGIVLYLFTSGVLGKGFESFDSLFHFNASSTFSFFDFSHPVTIGSVTGNQPPTTISAPSSGSSTTPVSTSTVNGMQIPAGYTIAQISPYYKEVELESITSGNSYSYGTIILNTNFAYDATGTIDITGWQIKSKNSGEYIPQAVAVYDPSGLTPASDIRVQNGDTVYLYSSSAPFNLRLNECIGYVAHVADFVPAIPLDCPEVNQSQIQNFTGACQNYIETIGSCQAPNMSSPQIPQTDYACKDYLENNFTYKSCFNAHESDANFLSNQVWVWTGSNVVDQYHDTVKLLDKNGLLVDQYTY
jgi:hypothetical protein